MDTRKYFRVKSPVPLDTGGVWHKLMRCQEHTGITVNLDPTVESRAKGAGHHLEWDVPDTEHNRAHLARFLPDFEEIEVKAVKKEEEKKPAKKSFFSKKEKEDTTKLRPDQVKELKSKIKEELDAAGVKYSTSATLRELQALSSQATSKK